MVGFASPVARRGVLIARFIKQKARGGSAMLPSHKPQAVTPLYSCERLEMQSL